MYESQNIPSKAMTISRTLSVTDREQWRRWLTKHHKDARDIWLVFYKKHTGKPRIPYNDAVEEALCFGWIDSTVKTLDADRFAQRFSPRKAGSAWSEMNKERIRRLIKAGRMTPAGLAAAGGKTGTGRSSPRVSAKRRLVIAPDILEALKRDPQTWKHFTALPSSYKRIRIGWIEGARKRPAMFKRRLRYFLTMTAKNKRFGMMQ